MKSSTLLHTLALPVLLCIASCAYSQTAIRTLDLKKKGISQLPINAVQQQNVEVLDLSDNQLTAIPDVVYKMTNLRKLILRGNKIQAIPAQISRLANLEELYISQCYSCLTSVDAAQPKTISDELYKLPKLRVLDMSYYGLSEISTAIAGSHIEELYVNNNKLTALPEEVFATGIKVIDVSYNYIKARPDHIAACPSLETLKLNGNNISELPEAVVHLSNIKELNLANNALLNPVTDVKRIVLMKHLARLNMNGDKITELPAELAELHELIDLDLSSNKMTAVPTCITQLSNLQKLSLSNNQLSALPASMADLGSLVKIDLSHNAFRTIPTELAMLHSLEVANLSHNADLNDYSENIKSLSAIKLVNLRNTGLNAFQVQHINEMMAASCELVY